MNNGMLLRGLLVIGLISLLRCGSVFGAPVTKDQIAQAAKTFITKTYPAADAKTAKTTTAAGQSARAVQTIRPVVNAGQTIGYVADLDTAGYVLLSSDDEAPPVKCYSEDGKYDKLPPGLVKVLNLELAEDLDVLAKMRQAKNVVIQANAGAYKAQWLALLNPAPPAKDVTPRTSAAAGTPILTTKWDQGNPYNSYCPNASGGPGGRAWAGCTACALSQILRYWSFPEAVAMDHTYNDTDGFCTGTHSISDAGMTAYNWADMPSSISASSSSAQRQAVAKLMYHAAVALNSDFESDGTAAYPSDVKSVFETYFSYTCGSYLRKSSYTSVAWYNMIAADIGANKPIFYGMWDAGGGSGHSVVCDGYKSGNQIHLNLGWSGDGNLWYNIDYVSRGGYVWTDHRAVFGITPVLPYTYTTNNGTITITGYTGSGGAVTIPNTIDGLPVTCIGDSVFSNCASLTSVTIPNTITNIGNAAFTSTYLTGVTIPNSVTSIGNAAFAGCGSLTSVTIPNGIKSICDYTFSCCIHLTNVAIPGSVTSIGKSAFDHCISLTSVTIPNSVTSIGDWAFGCCTSLAKVTIPNGVTTIGDYAFLYCGGLSSITFGDSVTNIGAYAFQYCTHLTSVTIPNSVTSIGDWAFTECSNLTAITVTALNPAYSSWGGVLFNKDQTTLIQCPCGKTGNYTIPISVTNIGNDAFYDCVNLQGVYFLGDAPGIGFSVFDGDISATVYHLSSASGWGPFFGGLPTATFSNQPPILTTRSPVSDPAAINEGASVAFSVTASDSTDPVDATRGMSNITWYVDGIQKQETKTGAPNAITSAFTFKTTSTTVQGAPFADVEVKATALDAWGDTTETTWTVRVNNVAAAQTISFPALPVKALEDPDFAPGATASSGLTVDYTSSNGSVAQIVGGLIHIVGGGTAVITASQSGDIDYRAATPVRQTLTVKARLTAAVPTGGGTVTGAGLYTSGATVSLTAKPNTGYTFLHWEDASQTATRSFVMPATNASVSACFGLTAGIAAPVIADPGPQGPMVGVPFYLLLDVTSDCLPTITLAGLPTGLKYNSAAKTITGVPLTAVSNKVVTINAKNTAGKISTPRTFTMTIDPLPVWAWGTFNGSCLVGSSDVGSATMTVTSQGKITGKLAAGGSNYAFKATSYAAGSDPIGGFSFTTNAVSGKSIVPLTLLVNPPAGSGPVALSVADGSGVVMYRNVWKDADMLSSATNLNGYYTATLPDLAALTNASDVFGSGYLAFTLTSGAVKTAGKLADGTAVSLSSTLLVDESNRCFTVLYTAPTAYKGGCLFGVAEFLATNSSVIVRSLDDVSFVWENRSPQATDVYGAGFSRDIDIVGGWYDKVGNLYTHYMSETLAVGTGDAVPAPETIVGTNRYASTWWNPAGLALSLVTNNLGVLTGITAPPAGAPVNLGGNVWDYSATNAVGLTFTFTRVTGVYKGSFKAWFDYGATHTSKSISFEGVMTPERENMTDGIEGRGFYLWADKAPTYSFNWSSDFVISGQ